MLLHGLAHSSLLDLRTPQHAESTQACQLGQAIGGTIYITCLTLDLARSHMRCHAFIRPTC